MYQEAQAVHAEAQQAGLVDTLLDVTTELPQVQCGLVHLFSKGYYARVLKVPAGTLVVAKRHKTRHPFSLVSGTMRVLDGEAVHEVSGPHNGVTDVGTQRVAYAVSDIVFMTLHKTNHTDLAAIEAEVIDTQEDL